MRGDSVCAPSRLLYGFLLLVDFTLRLYMVEQQPVVGRHYACRPALVSASIYGLLATSFPYSRSRALHTYSNKGKTLYAGVQKL